MRPRPPVSISPILGALALAALLADPIAAQYGRQGDGRLQLPWENNRFRLTHASVEPGATLSAGGNQVLVYLTADADGRMPAEAVWQPAGTGVLQNRGRARLQAIAIELKETRGPATGTPGEVLDAQYRCRRVAPHRQRSGAGRQAALRSHRLRRPLAFSR